MPNTKNDIKTLKITVSKLKKQADGMGSTGAKELYPLIEEINTKIALLEKEDSVYTPPPIISNEVMDTVRMARHQKRPTTLEYIKLITTDFIEMHGDRRFADDEAIVGGVALIDGIPVTIIGHQKGRNTKDNIRRHFGMAHPEGYRKALRLMEQAERYGRPIITFVDTPGAYPGIGAEERGQAEAIAYNMYVMSGLKTPIITFITGEGGSGGALGLAVADKVFMLSNTIYSVISPEGCATILWKDALQADKAAAALKLSAKNIKGLGNIIDDIIQEPGEGAHTDKEEMAKRIKTVILRSIKELIKVKPDVLVNRRYDKFRNMGVYSG